MANAEVVKSDMSTVISTSLTYEHFVLMRPDLAYVKVKDGQNVKCLFLYIDKLPKGAVLYRPDEMRSLEFGYCITVHKSQDSGWPSVYICHQGIDRITSFLNRKILYTAITRTKKNLVVVGNGGALCGMGVRNITQSKSLIDYYMGVRPKILLGKIYRSTVGSASGYRGPVVGGGTGVVGDTDTFGFTDFEDEHEPTAAQLLDDDFDF